MKKLISVILVAVMAAALVFTLASCAALTKEGFIEICETAEAKKAEVQKDSVTVTVSAVFKNAEGNPYNGIMLTATRTVSTVDGVTKMRIDEEDSVLSFGKGFVKAGAASVYFDGKDAYTVETRVGSDEKNVRKTENTTAAAALAEHPVAARKNNRGASLEMSDFSVNEFSGEKSYIFTCADNALFEKLVSEYVAYVFGDTLVIDTAEIEDGKGIYTVASDGCVHFDYIKLTGKIILGGVSNTFEYESSIKTVAEGDAVVVEPIPDMGTLFPDKPDEPEEASENTEVSEESGEDGQKNPDPEPDEKG